MIIAIASYLGIEGRGNLLKSIVACLGDIRTPVLLVLDNLETAWELQDTRADVEDVLSHLSGIENVSLVV